MTGFKTTDYCTLAQLRDLLLPAGQVASGNDDAKMGYSITAASRAIDQESNRQFGLTGSAVARYYTYDGTLIEGRPAVAIDDLMTSVGLVLALDTGTEGTYTGALTLGTDFDLWPRNAAADSKPWTHIVLRRAPVAVFPFWPGAIRVTGNFGWTTIPTAVTQAALIQAGRFFVRKDSLYGVAGSPDTSTMRLLARLDPDVALIISSYRRMWGVVK